MVEAIGKSQQQKTGVYAIDYLFVYTKTNVSHTHTHTYMHTSLLFGASLFIYITYTVYTCGGGGSLNSGSLKSGGPACD